MRSIGQRVATVQCEHCIKILKLRRYQACVQERTERKFLNTRHMPSIYAASVSTADHRARFMPVNSHSPVFFKQNPVLCVGRGFWFNRILLYLSWIYNISDQKYTVQKESQQTFGFSSFLFFLSQSFETAAGYKKALSFNNQPKAC